MGTEFVTIATTVVLNGYWGLCYAMKIEEYDFLIHIGFNFHPNIDMWSDATHFHGFMRVRFSK